MSTTLEPSPKMTTKEIFEAEKLVAEKTPLFLVEKEFLTIKTKTEGLKILTPSGAQTIVIKKIKDLLKLENPIRLIILKARQSWISTIIEAIIYAYTSQKTGINSMVVADELKKSNYLFDMQKLFHDKLDDHLKPNLRHSNEKKIEFDKIHSQILIDTADKISLGRTLTIQYAHLSEAAFYEGDKLEDILLALGHSVPNSPDTMIIIETTANGYNKFHELWLDAVDGKSDWKHLFIEWTKCPDYVLPLQNNQYYPIEGIKFATMIDKEKFLDEEKELSKIITPEQINYRRWDIVNNCGGSVLKFRQEMPLTWQEAFIASGDLFFDRTSLMDQKIKKPLFIGNIVKEEGEFVFRQDPTGVFKLYELPNRLEQYAIGGDPAEGLTHGDKSAGIVLNKRTNKTACVYNHNVAPDRFAEDLMKMGHYYNDALIACENKGYGYSVNQDLYKKYGSVYRKVKKKKGFTEPTLELGWNTNLLTRPQMLSQLGEEIFEGSTDLVDKDLIQQCWTFINNPKKKHPEAEQGKCDDVVFARAIAGQVRLEQPYKDKMFHKRKKPRYRGLAGY